jgi:hypothetical protein
MKPTKPKAELPVRVLRVEIRASNTGCFSWYGDVRRCCPYLVASRFGSRLHCALFDFGDGKARERPPERYDERELPIGAKRCPECIKADVPVLRMGDEVCAATNIYCGKERIRKGRRGRIEETQTNSMRTLYLVDWGNNRRHWESPDRLVKR